MSRDRVVLITGATTGIGLELAKLYSSKGYRLIITGRRKLHELKGKWLNEYANINNYCEIDHSLLSSITIIDHFLEAQKVNELDLLIHNAGVGWYGPLAEQSAHSIEEIFAVNTKTPIALSHLAIPRLRRGQGKIVFISSVAANLPCKDFAVYAASKAAINGFARSLRIEYKNEIPVTIIEPGATKTDMHTKAGFPENKINKRQLHSAEQVAIAIERAVFFNRKLSTIGYLNKIASIAGRKLPGLVASLAR